MKAKVKTWEQLQLEGFKWDYPYCYKGDKRNDSDAKFRYTLKDNVCGKLVTIVDIVDNKRGLVEVICDRRHYTLDLWMFESPVLIRKIQRNVEKKFRWASGEIRLNSFKIEFPCSMDSLTHEQAREVSKWILKVTK